MDTSEEQNDLVSEVIRHNRLSVLQEGLTNNTWPKRQLVEALFAAASSRRWDCLDALIDHSTPLMRYNKKGQTVLHKIACSCSTHPNVTEKMMEKILEIVSQIKNINLNNFINKRCNANDGITGTTTLHQVVVTRHVKCTQLLLSHGAKPNIRSGFYLKTPLMEAASKGHIELVELLLANNSNPHILDKGGHTALIYAAQSGKVVVLNKLIEVNCNVNVQNHTGNSALMQAAWSGHTECVRLLLAAGADVYQTDFLGRSVLRYAVKSHKKDLLELILEVTDDIPQDLSIGKAVVEQDDVQMLELLLKRGMPVKHSQTRDSVLHTAAEMGSLNCLKILLESKEELRLDINVISDAYGVSPLQRACAYGYHEIVSHLLTNGASPDFPSREGMTPLFYCMEVLQLVLTKSRGMECIKSLLRFGCDVDQTCSIRCRGSRIKLDMTHLGYSLMSCNLYSARMFVAAGAQRYNLSYSPQNRPAEIYPRELVSTPSERDNFMELVLQNPYCLVHLSRTAVRNSLRFNLERKIEELPLPTHIKEFLNLPELKAIIEEYAEKLDIEDSVIDEEYEDSLSYEDSDSTFDLAFGSSEESLSGDEDVVDDLFAGIA